MGRTLRYLLPTLLFGILLIPPHPASANPDLAGSWVTVPGEGTPTDPWGTFFLDISVDGEDVTIIRKVGGGRRNHTQIYPLKIGRKVEVKIDWWTGNRHMGAYSGGDKIESIRANWLDDGKVLRTESFITLHTSQGMSPVRTYAEYRLSGDGNTLTVIQLRSSRDRPLVYVYERAE